MRVERDSVRWDCVKLGSTAMGNLVSKLFRERERGGS